MKILLSFLAAIGVMVIMEVGNYFIGYGSFIIGWLSCTAYNIAYEYISEKESKKQLS